MIFQPRTRRSKRSLTREGCHPDPVHRRFRAHRTHHGQREREVGEQGRDGYLQTSDVTEQLKRANAEAQAQLDKAQEEGQRDRREDTEEVEELSAQPAPEASTTRRKRRSGRTAGDRPLWLMWPNIFVVLLIVALPFLIAVYTSFLSVDQYTLRQWVRAPWVRLENYVEALAGSNVLSVSALESLGISVAFSVLTTLIITPIGILAALTVNTNFRGRALLRSLYLVPYVIPTFVTALLWRMMFLPKTGLINRSLSAIGLADVNTYWLVGAKSFWAMTLTEVWAVWAFIYIMVLAGLQSIPIEQYEVAELDGANSWQKLTRVVLPQLRGLIYLALLLSTLFHFNNFTLPFVMFGTPPPSAVTVLPLNIYLTSFNLFDFSLGSAMSVITLIIMLVPGFFYLRMLRLGEVTSR